VPDVDAEDMALAERAVITNFTVKDIGINIYSGGQLTDPVDEYVLATMVDEASVEIFSRPAEKIAVGKYQTTLSTAETGTQGLFLIFWDFVLATGGGEQTIEIFIEVQAAAPLYDALKPEFQAVVDGVWNRFADLFDSPLGGPHLQTYAQTNFGRQRMAQLLMDAVSELNVYAQPHYTYSIDGSFGTLFPTQAWGGVLTELLYVEVLRHLRRSYVEQPIEQGVNVARLDRTQYSNAWASILSDEEARLETMIGRFRQAHLGFGTPSVVVSGGAYGNIPGRIAQPLSLLARPHYWTRYL
jgi:hypothetical protein